MFIILLKIISVIFFFSVLSKKTMSFKDILSNLSVFKFLYFVKEIYARRGYSFLLFVIMVTKRVVEISIFICSILTIVTLIAIA